MTGVFDSGVFDAGVLDVGVSTSTGTIAATMDDFTSQFVGTGPVEERISAGQPIYWRDRQLQQIYAEDDELIQILTKVLEAA